MRWLIFIFLFILLAVNVFADDLVLLADLNDASNNHSIENVSSIPVKEKQTDWFLITLLIVLFFGIIFYRLIIKRRIIE